MLSFYKILLEFTSPGSFSFFYSNSNEFEWDDQYGAQSYANPLHMSNYFQNIQISFKLLAKKKKEMMQSPINERSELSHGLEFNSGPQ